MKYYARILAGIVAEVIGTSEDINNLYHPQFVAELVACDQNIQQGWLFDGKAFKAPPPTIPDLVNVKQSLKSQIDQAAETERLKYITPGDGQAMTYQEKVNQAAEYSKAYAAYKAASKERSEPNADGYLLLKASLGIDGDTLLEVAEKVTYAYGLWQKVGAAIETIRLQTKAAIDTAETTETAQAIFNAIQWPNPKAKK